MSSGDWASVCATSFWCALLAAVGWAWFKPLFVFVMAMVATAGIFFLCIALFTLTRALFLWLIDRDLDRSYD